MMYKKLAEISTYIPHNNKLVRPSTNGADVFWIPIWLLLKCGAKSWSERTTFALSKRVASYDAERVVRPRLQADRRRMAVCSHSRSFDELVWLIK